jgi:hypothetical protein
MGVGEEEEEAKEDLLFKIIDLFKVAGCLETAGRFCARLLNETFLSPKNVDNGIIRPSSCERKELHCRYARSRSV